ncbi:recombinase family protein [Embleya sp. NBC_00896]|uniref:recombinase family protein n=1 Tax=Embleya sp. NBC_00896 TaxID=2975961 RepID=UPI002F906EA2|nr:recombinase family protein [Embleya sp. NBC_00896]
MADLLYLRHSTDKQTNGRQKHALGSYLADGARSFEDPATSSRIHPLGRGGFRGLLDEAAVGDTVRVADAARLFHSVKDVLDVRAVLRRRGVHLRVAAGAWSGMDLTADDPMTKLFVTMLAGVLEFQRDMISENTREGVAAAVAAGKTLGRPAVFDARTAAEVVTAYREGTAVKALAREHGVDPRTVRRALDAAGARELPADVRHILDGADEVEGQGQAERVPADEPTTLDVPGLLAEHLQGTPDDAVRGALRAGWAIRRGRGYSLRVTAPLTLHQAVLGQCAALVGDGSTPAGRKAYRTYADRIAAATEA